MEEERLLKILEGVDEININDILDEEPRKEDNEEEEDLTGLASELIKSSISGRVAKLSKRAPLIAFFIAGIILLHTRRKQLGLALISVI